MAVVAWKGRSGIVAEFWGHRAEYRGEPGLGAGWVACTLLRKPICSGRPGPAEITQTCWKGLSGVLLSSVVCYAGKTQRVVREPRGACLDHLLASTQPPMKWLLP